MVSGSEINGYIVPGWRWPSIRTVVSQRPTILAEVFPGMFLSHTKQMPG